ncbi:unnamed protein product (macronuclear) [Paramecium tetraurelia]|uniref:Uncharacterized protein n=1 Tax=Paramecium tetraurelia TaxID=5888 RepID=A0CIG7_PARTE|nr:uncharacterized protein GSPATT00007719001 [Paramecium tetraurelia]CAK70584.1 unnamed protein product [Paramecium tetraurelia]|eukprot:XP_001437981.1 hypothetical protein (macronuclear) [Paramecium tetraurelia strain d4-2]
MKLALVLLALIGLTYGISSKISHAKKLEELQRTKLGQAILNLVNLHSQVQGPIQELVEMIEELIQDINNNMEDVQYTFLMRTNEHNSYIVQVSQQLQDADSDIARMMDVIDNLLMPRKIQITTRIESLIENDEFNRKNVDEITLLRDQENQAYQQQIQEDNEAIDAADDAINLVSSLSNPSLFQIKNIKFTLKRLSQKQWNRVNQGPMVLALLQIALNQNFADSEILKQIVDALNEFRNQIVDAMNDLTKQEQLNYEEFLERLDQLDVEHLEFQKQINQAQVDLDATTQKLNDCTQFLIQREADRLQYQQQLDLENETYVVDTDIYNQNFNQLQAELPIAQQGLSLIKSADFSDIKI